MASQLVAEGIAQTLTMTGIRIYGGHVYIAAGSVRELPPLLVDTA